MSFLSGLAAFGGGVAEEALAVKKQQSDQMLKQQMVDIREAQLQLLMQKTTQAQQGSQAEGAIYNDPAYQALFGGQGGTPPPSDPAAALQFAPPGATGGPSGGPTGQASAPPYAPPAASGGAGPAATAPAAISQALQQGQRPASQPPGAAGAGMPTPQPQAGQPAAQLQQMPQGQQGQPGAQPQVPPGPGGAPSFDQRFQGQPQGQPIQAKPVQTQRIPGQQPSLGAGPPQAPLPDQTFRPQQPKGKRLFDLATPEQQAQAGITQQQPPPEQQQRQQAQKMAQAPEQTIMEVVKKHATPGMDVAKTYQKALKHYYDERSKQDIHDIHEIQKKASVDKAKKEQQHEHYMESIVKGAKEGKVTSDDLKFYKDNLEIKGRMLDAGVDLNKMHRDTEKQKKIIQSIYSQRGVQFKGLLGRGEGEIQRVLALSDKLQLSGFGPYNRTYLDWYADKNQNTEKGQLVRAYLTATSEVAETLAKLAVGGYAPTDSAWNQANKQIHEDFGVKAMHAAMDESLRFLNISKNVLDEIEATGTYESPKQPKEQQQGKSDKGPAGIPKAGAVEDGYRFIGGNPSDQKNWEKVQ